MPLVARTRKVYPADLAGRYRRARRVVAWLLLAFFVITPWIPVFGLPAVQLDIPARRVLFLGMIFTPHDNWVLALLLVIAAVGLFLWTAVLGRIWCGWACPQTVFLEWVYRPIERLLEGASHKRKKRDEGPSSFDRAWRKVIKHAIFAALVFVSVGVFFTWFIGGPQLLRGEIGAPGMTMWALLFVVFYFDIGWFREQTCTLVCPYARFQGALMDVDSLAVVYDPFRGEPRGKKRKNDAEDKGDCVDCRRCVQVCPTGIDIRDGDQLSCIACTACADACDAVMVKIGKPTGLVRYTTDRDSPGHAGEARLKMGFRRWAYAAILLVLFVGLGAGLVGRSELKVAVARSGVSSLYNELPDGRISNQMSVHISNRDRHDHDFRVISGTEGVDVTVPGLPWTVGWGDEARLQGFVIADRASFQGGRLPAVIVVEREDGVRKEFPITLLGPGPGHTRLSLAGTTEGEQR